MLPTAGADVMKMLSQPYLQDLTIAAAKGAAGGAVAPCLLVSLESLPALLDGQISAMEAGWKVVVHSVPGGVIGGAVAAVLFVAQSALLIPPVCIQTSHFL